MNHHPHVIILVSSSACHWLNSFFIFLLSTIPSNRSQSNLDSSHDTNSELSILSMHSRLSRIAPGLFDMMALPIQFFSIFSLFLDIDIFPLREFDLVSRLPCFFSQRNSTLPSDRMLLELLLLLPIFIVFKSRDKLFWRLCVNFIVLITIFWVCLLWMHWVFKKFRCWNNNAFAVVYDLALIIETQCVLTEIFPPFFILSSGSTPVLTKESLHFLACFF